MQKNSLKMERRKVKIEKADSPEGEIAFVTAQLPYGEIIEKIAALESRGAKVISKIRIGDL